MTLQLKYVQNAESAPFLSPMCHQIPSADFA